MRVICLVLMGVVLTGCADQEARDAADAAEARAASAYALADEQRVRADDLEERLERLEYR